LPSELAKFFSDLDFNKLRVARPTRFVFLCGGVILKEKKLRAANLRDYLCRIRPLKLNGQIVLAEKATQLYRDTSYADLITFEEDIARIAAIVLVTAESAGALAELGAFASNETIRPHLRILLQQKFDDEESFVRQGPIRRIRGDKRDHVGVFPWQTRDDGRLVSNSVTAHYKAIEGFINSHLDAVPKSAAHSKLDLSSALFYVTLWVIHVSHAVSEEMLFKRVQQLVPGVSLNDIKNKIFCMKLAGWIEKLAYGSKDYYCTCYDADPFLYSFKDGVKNRDSVRRKMALKNALASEENVPREVRRKVREFRSIVGERNSRRK
jgi:hypothetical protein